MNKIIRHLFNIPSYTCYAIAVYEFLAGIYKGRIDMVIAAPVVWLAAKAFYFEKEETI